MNSTAVRVVIGASVASVLGLVLGAWYAYATSLPDFGKLAAMLPGLLIIAGVIVMAGLAALMLLLRRRQATAFWLAACLGLVGGVVIGGALGPAYRDTTTGGVVRLRLGTAVLLPREPVTCVPGGDARTPEMLISSGVRLIDWLVTLRVTLDGDDVPRVELFE